jgi:ribosomal protein S18 acetylase RimI-like enzyme
VDVSLRSATISDIDALFAIHRAAMRGYIEQAYGPWDEAWQDRYFRDHFDTSVRRVVELDGDAIGFIDVIPRDGDVFISELVLAPAWHNRGVGTELLRGAMATAAEAHVPARLQVLLVNPARGLYERLGFVVYGVTETHYLMEWRPA